MGQRWPCLGHTPRRKPTDPLRRAIKREELGLLKTGVRILGAAKGLADIGLRANGHSGTDDFPVEGKPEPSKKCGGLLFQVRHGASGGCGRRAGPTNDEREDNAQHMRRTMRRAWRRDMTAFSSSCPVAHTALGPVRADGTRFCLTSRLRSGSVQRPHEANAKMPGRGTPIQTAPVP